jgi:hypothetical protein
MAPPACTNTIHDERGLLGAPIVVRAALVLLATLASLTIGSASAHAGTWNIFPSIENVTGSSAPTCPSGIAGQGCIVLESAGIVDGDWTSSPAGGNRGVPSGSSDQPNFDAPHLAEGADGYWAYEMPDGSQFSLVAEDDQGVVDAVNQAYPGCGVAPGQGPSPEGFTCLASYPPGTNGRPSSSSFRPVFRFYSYGGMAPPFTAAGQVCSTTTGSALCAAGEACDTNYTGILNCRTKAPVSGTGQLSPTDPNNWMWLNFVNLGDSPVTMMNLASVSADNPPPHYLEQCTMQSKGDTCALQTSGGCAMSSSNCGSDAITMTVGGGATNGSVMVMQQAEVPVDMAEDWISTFDTALENAIWSIWTDGPPCPQECDSRQAPRKTRISKLRAAATTVRAAKDRRAPAVRVSYRTAGNVRKARSVLTFARERAGVRRGGKCVVPGTGSAGSTGTPCKAWVDLPGVSTRASIRTLWTPERGRSCPKSAQRGPKNGSRCQQRVTLDGHQQHRDVAGVNRVTVSKVNGRKLAPGRYRVTVRSLSGARKSAAVSTRFRIGKAS